MAPKLRPELAKLLQEEQKGGDQEALVDAFHHGLGVLVTICHAEEDCDWRWSRVNRGRMKGKLLETTLKKQFRLF